VRLVYFRDRDENISENITSFRGIFDDRAMLALKMLQPSVISISIITSFRGTKTFYDYTFSFGLSSGEKKLKEIVDVVEMSLNQTAITISWRATLCDMIQSSLGNHHDEWNVQLFWDRTGQRIYSFLHLSRGKNKQLLEQPNPIRSCTSLSRGRLFFSYFRPFLES